MGLQTAESGAETRVVTVTGVVDTLTAPELVAFLTGQVKINPVTHKTTVIVEAFDPKTLGLLKVLGGFRQQLEWVPFFFFGYALIRTKRRFRQLFLVLGVIAVGMMLFMPAGIWGSLAAQRGLQLFPTRRILAR